jgi:hypothetical protein
MTLRVSVTDLEAFRLCKVEEWMDLDRLLSQLRREEPPTIEMQAGTALHAILEEVDAMGTGYEHGTKDGFTFFFDLDAELEIRPIRELKATKEYHIAGHTVTLVGKVDAFDGFNVDDHKLTDTWDAEKYTDSYQWRAYLTILEAKAFNYNVFVGSQVHEKHGGAYGNGGVILGTNEWVIRDFHKLTFYRYPGMEQDVFRLLTEYVRFIETHLPERLAA